MSYLHLSQTGTLLDYHEYAAWREESWIYDDYIYTCIWFWSNNDYLPNSITKKELK